MTDLPELSEATSEQYYSRIKFTQFWDKSTGEVSLDRLGRSNIEPKVRTYLLPRAIAQAKSYAKPRRFDGWAHIKAEELQKAKYPPSLVLVASPIEREPDKPEESENIYHSHIEKPLDGYAQALHLRNLFEMFGDVEAHNGDSSEADTGKDTRGPFHRFLRFLFRTVFGQR